MAFGEGRMVRYEFCGGLGSGAGAFGGDPDSVKLFTTAIKNGLTQSLH